MSDLSLFSQVPWTQVAAVVAERLGLHFPPERRDDLERGLRAAAQHSGCADLGAYVALLLAAAPDALEMQVLAQYLTVGETYFFRDRELLEVLERQVLLPLIEARRAQGRTLRIWSAGCSTGEEPYTLAMMLHRLLPDLAEWQVSITATDVNPQALRKARQGVYGEWSFRQCPAGLKSQYFETLADGRHAVLPHIRRLVQFDRVNLVQETDVAFLPECEAVDLVLCRNVLMYFGTAQRRKVVARLHRALRPGGWLAVSPTETCQNLFAAFDAVNSPRAILYRKRRPGAGAAGPGRSAPASSLAWSDPAAQGLVARPLPPVPSPVPLAGSSLPAIPRRADAPAAPAGTAQAASAAARSAAPPAPAAPAAAAEFAAMARASADRGDLDRAVEWCNRWTADAKLDPVAHYVRAMVLLEQGTPARARAALRRAIFLDPGFVLAHFVLGNLARGEGRHDEARRHYANATQLLARYAPEDLLPEGEGLRAGRLLQVIAGLTSGEEDR